MIRIGNFHISSDVFFALLAIGLLILVIYLKIPIPYIDPTHLLFLTIILLIARAFVPKVFIGWIIGSLLLIYILQYFLTIPFAPLIVALLLIFLIFGFFSR